MTSAAEQHVVSALEQIERAIDDEMERIDNLDDDDLAKIRNKRMKQLQEMQKRKQEWITKGHGSYQEVTEAVQFFNFAKNSERVVCHFKRRATERCNVVDHHLTDIAKQHYETLFCGVDVERLPQLAERFSVMMLPTIMLVEGGNTFHSIIGFDDFGGTDDFPTSRMEQVLEHYGMINDRSMFDADQSH